MDLLMPPLYPRILLYKSKDDNSHTSLLPVTGHCGGTLVDEELSVQIAAKQLKHSCYIKCPYRNPCYWMILNCWIYSFWRPIWLVLDIWGEWDDHFYAPT